MRYVTFRFEDRGEVVALLEREDLVKHLPIEASVSVWKQEVYFETGIDLEGDLVLNVEPGTLAYWPPGRALCLFYGVSQPYSPVIRLGKLLGPLYYLAWVEEGEGVEVVRYEDYGTAGEVAKSLRERGIAAAARSWEGTDSVVVLLDGFRAEVFVEEFGYPVESEALFLSDNSAITCIVVSALRGIGGEKVRIDLNEEGHVILSSFAENIDELERVLRRMASAWREAWKLLGKLSGLPCPKAPPHG